jgi:hypothetical protein
VSDPILVVEDAPEWIEISRVEALARIEQMLTLDLVAFEIDPVADVTAVGNLQTFIWLLTTEDDEQTPVLLALRDPVLTDAPMRWFLHSDLVAD